MDWQVHSLFSVIHAGVEQQLLVRPLNRFVTSSA